MGKSRPKKPMQELILIHNQKIKGPVDPIGVNQNLKRVNPLALKSRRIKKATGAKKNWKERKQKVRKVKQQLGRCRKLEEKVLADQAGKKLCHHRKTNLLCPMNNPLH